MSVAVSASSYLEVPVLQLRQQLNDQLFRSKVCSTDLLERERMLVGVDGLLQEPRTSDSLVDSRTDWSKARGARTGGFLSEAQGEQENVVAGKTVLTLV